MMFKQAPFVVALALTAQLLVFSPSVTAVLNGVPDGQNHPWACAMAVRIEGKDDNCYQFYCSCSLIDSKYTAMEDLTSYSRRTVLTAGHCLLPDGDDVITDPVTGVISSNVKILVTFNDQPDWDACDDIRAKAYSVKKAFYAPGLNANFKATTDVGNEDDDFAILILEDEVSIIDVPGSLPVLNHPNAPYYKQYKSKASFPGGIVGTAGFGIEYYGDPDKGGLGTPYATDGPMARMYVELKVMSVSSKNIVGSMRLVQGEQTLCGGDSGSAALVPAGGKTVILGTTYAGDANCRAVNTWARVDTPVFFYFLGSVAEQL